jgi:hypothetical protein
LQRFLYLIWKLVFTIICQWAQHTSWHFHVVDVKLNPSLQLLHDIESIMPLKTAISSYPWPTIDIQRETLLIACSCFFIVLSKVHWIQKRFWYWFYKDQREKQSCKCPLHEFKLLRMLISATKISTAKQPRSISEVWHLQWSPNVT